MPSFPARSGTHSSICPPLPKESRFTSAPPNSTSLINFFSYTVIWRHVGGPWKKRIVSGNQMSKIMRNQTSSIKGAILPWTAILYQYQNFYLHNSRPRATGIESEPSYPKKLVHFVRNSWISFVLVCTRYLKTVPYGWVEQLSPVFSNEVTQMRWEMTNRWETWHSSSPIAPLARVRESAEATPDA